MHHISKVETDWDARLDGCNLITLCPYYHELAESGAISAETLHKWAHESEEGISPLSNGARGGHGR